MATRIADNPKIWARISEPELAPDPNIDPPYAHEWGMGFICKHCGSDYLSVVNEGIEQCQARKP
jgi:hypothetical protein